MTKSIFVNLPIKDLKASIDFYSSIGFTLNPQFTDETAACMVLSDTIYVMLLTHPKFKEFIPVPIGDAQKDAQVINALSCDSTEEVKRIKKAALDSGGQKSIEAKDLGFMYQDGFRDPDGHFWEIFYMDMSKFPS